MSGDKKENWFRKHWIISIFLGLIILGVIGSLSEDNSNGIDQENLDTITGSNFIEKEIEENKETIYNSNKFLEIVEKQSGYTLDDCLNICEEAYNIQAQIDVCTTNCYMIGNPGSSMDKLVNGIKDIRDRN